MDVDIEQLEETLVEAVKPRTRREVAAPDRLSEKEQKFIVQYCESLNALDAHRKAFGGKMLDDERKIEIDRLLARPDVERRLKPMLAKKLDSVVSVAPHWVMKYIQEIMSLDPLDFYDADGNVLPLDEIPFEKRKFLRVGKPVTNNKTGQRYITYDIPPMMAALDKLFEVVKLVTTVNANKAPDSADLSEVEDRRKRILDSID